MKTKLIIVLFTLTSLVGCTSMQTMNQSSSELTDQLEAGDHLIVYEKSGRIVDMKLSAIDGDVLKGELTGKIFHTVEVNINDIAKIEIEKIDGGKTTLAIVGGIILLPIVVFAAALADS